MSADFGDLRGLLLDFDGTIAETERHGHRVAYNRAFADFGLDWDWDETLYGELLAVAGGQERLHHYVATFHPERLAEDVAAGLFPKIHRTKAEHFARSAPQIPLRPGVLPLVLEAHAAGIVVGIATTAAEVGVRALLGGHPSLAAAIDTIVGGEAVSRKKPSPEVYLVALDRLGLSAAECVALEDSRIGLQAAVAAGIPTIVSPCDYTAGEDFSGAAAVFPDLSGVDLDAVRAIRRAAARAARQPLQPDVGLG
jgi:HAD superfamily hydrolase (TIGR01509 family)